MNRRIQLFVVLIVGVFFGFATHAADRTTDKRLSRAAELYKLETGKTPSDGSFGSLSNAERNDLTQRNKDDLREMREMLQKVAEQREPDDDGAVRGGRSYRVKKGVLANSLDEILREPGAAVDEGYKLVWRAPQYMVPEEFDVQARDALGALEKVLEAYNREGVSLEAVLFSGNKVIEVSVSGFRQKARLATPPVASPEASE